MLNTDLHGVIHVIPRIFPDGVVAEVVDYSYVACYYHLHCDKYIPERVAMGTLRLAVNCAFPVVMGLVCVAAATTCRRRFVGGGRDCGTRTDICTVGDVNGPDLNSVPFPSEK